MKIKFFLPGDDENREEGEISEGDENADKTEARQSMKQCDLELTFSLDNYDVRIKMQCAYSVTILDLMLMGRNVWGEKEAKMLQQKQR